MFAKFFQFKKNLFLAILLLVIFVLPTKALAQDLLTVGSSSSVLSGTESAIFANISNSSPTSTFLLMLKSGVASKFSVDKDGNANVVGTVTAGSFSGPLTGTIGAAYVSSGSFGLFTGEGDNYSFPSRLGIGTTTPASALHIISNSGVSYNSLYVQNTRGDYQGVRYTTTGGTGNYLGNNVLFEDARPDTVGAVGNFFTIYRSSALSKGNIFQVGNTTAASSLVVDGAGKIGIGTTAPQQKLDVRGYIQVGADGESGKIGGINFKRTTYGGTNNSASIDFWRGGSGGEGLLAFSTRTDDTDVAPVERMRIDNNGNVGIGTTAPGSKLTVRQNGATLRLETASSPNTYYTTLTSNYDSANPFIINSGGSQIAGTKSLVTNADTFLSSYYNLMFATGATTPAAANIRMFITQAGNVGIGTTTPGAKLDVTASTGDTVGLSVYTANTSNSAYAVNFNRAATNVQNAFNWQTAGANKWFFGQDNDLLSDDLILYDWSASKYVMKAVSATGDIGFGNNYTSLYIKNGGNVGIGTTTPAAGLEVVAGGNYSILAGSKRIGNVAAPVDLYDAVNRYYVDSNFVASTTMTNAFVQGGNSFGTKAILGTNDAGALGIKTMNVERMTFLVNGYTGIGTMNPGAPLEIVGYGTDRTLTLGTDPYAAGQSGSIVFKHSYETTSGQYDSVRMNVNGSTAGYSNAADYFSIDTATGVNTWANRLAMTLNGNVGIGTTNPSNKFQIGSNSLGWSNNDAVISNSNGGIAIANNSGYSYIFGSNRLDLYGNSTNTLSLYFGNVGIGTTTPNARLDIKGNLKITDAGTIYNSNSSRWLYMNSEGDSLKVNGSLYSTAGFLKTDGEGINYMMGSLGVGKNNPQARLEVLGEIRSSALSGNNAVISMRNSTSSFTSFLTSTGDGFMSTSMGHLNISGKTYLALGVNGQSRIFIASSTNVGIGTPTPTKSLDVVGYINASSGLCIGGDCIDSWGDVIGTFNSSTPLTVGNLTVSTIVMDQSGGLGNILNVRKLTVGTIDPLYRIDGTNYSSFASAIVGGVKEEYLGRVKISKLNSAKEYEYRLDFSKLSAPSDLWVWRQTVDFSPENVEVNITPYGAFANTYYIIEDEAIIFRANKPVTVSYRLAGKRLDWQNWPTEAKDQQEKPSFIINNKKLIK